MAAAEQIRAFWDDDAATYDLAHQPRSAAVQAAWNAALARFLPPAPAHVLDAGAGTGFLSLAMGGWATTSPRWTCPARCSPG